MKIKIWGLFALAILSIFPYSLYADTYSELPNPFKEVATSSFDSLNVRYIGSWPFGPSEVVAFDSLRNLAFVGSGGGVYVLDVSDSTNPVKISEDIHTRNWIRSLYFDKTTQRLCIANYYAGFEIWNTADPQNPVRLCSYRDIFPVLDICARDSLAYVANKNTGLHIFNVSDPMNPQEIGFLHISSSKFSLTIKDSYAYMVSADLSIIDISNPEKPELAGFWDNPGTSYDVCVFDTLAFILGNYMNDGYVWILNVSDPSNPLLVSTYTLPYESPDDITVKDSIVYVACDWQGFLLINVSDPLDPFICGYVNLSSRDIAVALPYAYVAASWCQGMRIINVANPSNPYQIGQYKGPKQTEDVWVTWPYAYIANNEGGFRILDISDAQNPYEISYCEFPLTIVQSVFVVDSLAYITCQYDTRGLIIINIKDPFNPGVIGQCLLPGHPYDIFVKDSFAYVTDTDRFHGNAGFRIINIADPTNPYQVSYYSTNWGCYGIYVRDSLAYFTARDFHIVDISNPSNIKEVGYYDPAGYAHGVYVDGNIAYVTGNLGTYVDLLILDISDPRNPEKIASFDTPGTFARKKCFVHDSYVYLSDADGGLRFIDVSSPSNPFEAGYYQAPAFLVLNAFLSDPYVYVAAACLGLQIFEFYGAGVEEEKVPTSYPTKLQLIQNPVRGNSIELLLSSSKIATIELYLYNLLGQKIRAYSFGNLKSGKNILRLDVEGLTTGTYFLKLENELSVQPIKVILLK